MGTKKRYASGRWLGKNSFRHRLEEQLSQFIGMSVPVFWTGLEKMGISMIIPVFEFLKLANGSRLIGLSSGIFLTITDTITVRLQPLIHGTIYLR
jgi:hypothetical protein